jgi:hypothetical protein
MKTKILAVFSLLLAFFSLSSCSSKSIYGRYSLQMGKSTGTHFVIAANLGQDVSPYDATKNAFYFDYQNVYVPSSSSTPSSSSEEVVSSSSSSSSDEQSVLSTLFPLEGAWILGEDKSTIEMDIWFSADEVDEATSSSSSSLAPITSSSSSSNSSSEEPAPSGPVSIPYSFTKYFLKIVLNGKGNLVVTLPVSVNDAITAIEAYFEGKTPEEVKINVVEIELAKE